MEERPLPHFPKRMKNARDSCGCVKAIAAARAPEPYPKSL